MAKLNEILMIESQRDDAEAKCQLHLFQEGSFYRAYEWSAWLFVKFISSFKVTCKDVKGTNRRFAFIGFPVSSITKRLPEGSEFIPLEEKHSLVELAALKDLDVSVIDGWKEEFEEWKSKLPLDEPKEKEHAALNQSTILEVPSLSAIAQQLLAFPIERKTPIECMLFVAELKEKVAKLF